MNRGCNDALVWNPETGWWLVTHVDHAQLAGAASAAQWGNDLFLGAPSHEIVCWRRYFNAHDDGWAARDQHPQITRQGKAERIFG